MSEHRNTARTIKRRSPLRSVRVRALLSLGVALGIGATGTFAFWSDDAVISGSTFSAGRLDIKANGVDSYSTTTLSMSAMVPGSTSAEVIPIGNGGTVPLKYSLTGILGGTDAATFASNAGLKLTIVLNGTKVGTGNSSTCSAGTATIFGPTTLTTTSATLLNKRGPVAVGSAESLCFQVSFDDTSATGALQSKTASATFTATGTSDLS